MACTRCIEAGAHISVYSTWKKRRLEVGCHRKRNDEKLHVWLFRKWGFTDQGTSTQSAQNRQLRIEGPELEGGTRYRPCVRQAKANLVNKRTLRGTRSWPDPWMGYTEKKLRAHHFEVEHAPSTVTRLGIQRRCIRTRTQVPLMATTTRSRTRTTRSLIPTRTKSFKLPNSLFLQLCYLC